jgi:hypothetical protein
MVVYYGPAKWRIAVMKTKTWKSGSTTVEAKKCRTKGCQAQAVIGQRLCKECKKALLKELEEAGYLQPRPRGGRFRTSDMRENVHETKHGR